MKIIMASYLELNPNLAVKGEAVRQSKKLITCVSKPALGVHRKRGLEGLAEKVGERLAKG